MQIYLNANIYIKNNVLHNFNTAILYFCLYQRNMYNILHIIPIIINYNNMDIMGNKKKFNIFSLNIYVKNVIV